MISDTKIVGNKNVGFFAYIEFSRNDELSTALDRFVDDISSAGYKERRHNFNLEAVNDKGFLDPGSISVRWGMENQPNDLSPLREMKEFVDSIDPLNGKNVARYVAANFTDNGNGTMTIRRQLPYEKAMESS